VSGGPASTCGELHTFRNGSWITASNWICTDASGNATKGPWTWAGTASDQTDDPSYILWPDTSETTRAKHVWDKTCPTVTRTSAGGSPPTAWSGTASDAAWGCGFNAAYGYDSWAIYEDLTNNTEWTPGTGAYTATPNFLVSGTLTGTPGFNVSWSAPFPGVGSHTTGHHYQWRFCARDCCCSSCTYYDFWY